MSEFRAIKIAKKKKKKLEYNSNGTCNLSSSNLVPGKSFLLKI